MQLPTMEGSSRKEIEFAAHGGAMLYACGLISTPLTVASLSKSLVSGKAAKLTDMRFDLDVAGKDMLLEYDHPVTHGEDRV